MTNQPIHPSPSTPEQIKKSVRTLRIQLWGQVLFCFLLILLFETGQAASGPMADDKVLNYYVAIPMELITICLIPVALRLMKFRRVKEQIARNPLAAVRTWSIIRIDLICFPMILNCMFYYVFMNVAFGYMGIIALLCLPMINPTERRFRQEMGQV